jgi:hypothetical protein
MSQHDFNIANQSFPATRTDLNNALVALASNSSGDAEPGTTYANQWWYETDTNILKIRNEANNAWIEIATLDQTSNNVLSITTQGLTLGATALTATGAEINKLSGATVSTTELNQLDAITRGSILYGNASGETARLAAGGASTVLTSDGTDISWGAASGSTFTLLASVNTTSGTAIDFTGIPSGVNRVTLNLYNVGMTAQYRLLVQLGDSGGIEASGYIASSAHTAGGQYSTNGFPITRTVTSNFTSGIMILTRVTGNQWVSTHSTTRDTSGTGAFGGGHKTLSGELTQLRLTRATAGNFDQGNVSLSYE